MEIHWNDSISLGCTNFAWLMLHFSFLLGLDAENLDIFFCVPLCWERSRPFFFFFFFFFCHLIAYSTLGFSDGRKMALSPFIFSIRKSVPVQTLTHALCWRYYTGTMYIKVENWINKAKISFMYYRREKRMKDKKKYETVKLTWNKSTSGPWTRANGTDFNSFPLLYKIYWPLSSIWQPSTSHHNNTVQKRRSLSLWYRQLICLPGGLCCSFAVCPPPPPLSLSLSFSLHYLVSSPFHFVLEQQPPENNIFQIRKLLCCMIVFRKLSQCWQSHMPLWLQKKSHTILCILHFRLLTYEVEQHMKIMHVHKCALTVLLFARWQRLCS